MLGKLLEAMEIEGLKNSDNVMEGTNIETLKIYFSSEKDMAKDHVKAANQLYASRRYRDAKTEYQIALKSIKGLKDKVIGLKNDLGSGILSWIIPYAGELFALFATFDSTIIASKFTSQTNWNQAYDETMSWNTYKTYAVANFNKVINWCEMRIKQCDSELKARY